ncbi:MAG TPA: signal peptidase I [Firmicutes bacterium]|nr:signal peptidase I [Bacillota bacterium]
MSTSNISINNINRFDIIVLKYSEAQTSYNIKRVIALPGETFYINSSIDDNNGNLNIFDKNKNEYVVVDQPIDSYHLKNGMYPNKYSSPITLENDEYFVMGDNRLSGNSMDSRSVGPIKRNLILGVAKGLNGKASVIYDNGNYEVKNVAHHFPRFF